MPRYKEGTRTPTTEFTEAGTSKTIQAGGMTIHYGPAGAYAQKTYSFTSGRGP